MTETAKKSGLSRQNLYRALSPSADPKFSTVQKVIEALGCRLPAGDQHQGTLAIGHGSPAGRLLQCFGALDQVNTLKYINLVVKNRLF